MKIALFLPNWIGDAVMATPAIRAIREHYLDAEIFGIMRPYVGQVLEGLDLVDRTLLYSPRTRNPELKAWNLSQELRSEKIDIAVLFPNSLRTAAMAWLSGASRRVGFSRDLRGWLLTDRLQPLSRKVPNPVVDEYLRLAEHLGCTQLTRQTELAVTSADEDAIEMFWRKQGSVLHNKGTICINSGGAFGAAKDWPKEYFAELARKLAVEQNKTILVLCGPSEVDNAREIVRQADHPQVITLAGEKLSLGLTKAAIRESELLITTDSGPRHFAQPFNVPVVSLYGPTHIAWSDTYYDKGINLQKEVDCGPCQKRDCPLGHHRCMTGMKVETVYQTVVSLWEQGQSGQVRRAA
ncbi:ADP-heptose--LPS heptosyltransferase 2 [Polystyrenella longa]|uniref:lipopolysaccharide heptosyltransferase II n=1 Tax=Polystyrenella longa TaxID=2528007 RepID=A0A518CPQ9_9PLAN|nr:lipopolysaccharide heptosyltransferase II [Polystyrenella longa]QDU81216.1 ADP-heptose--LPS heptosyltransferase 2 [Polystyrenella longa]